MPNYSDRDLFRPKGSNPRDRMNPAEEMFDQGDPTIVYGPEIDKIEKSFNIPPGTPALSDFLDTLHGRTLFYDTQGDPDKFLNAYSDWLSSVRQDQPSPDPNYGDWNRDMENLKWRKVGQG